MKQKPEILNIEPLMETRLFRVEAVDLKFTNGQQRRFERMHRPLAHSVMIVPITSAQELVLIREYAVGMEDYELTFPKGFVDQDEDVLVAANRELQEEVGLAARNLHKLKQVYSSAAYSTGQMSIVLADDLYPQTLVGDEPEPLEIVYWPISDYKKLLEQPDFITGISIMSLLLTIEKLSLW